MFFGLIPLARTTSGLMKWAVRFLILEPAKTKRGNYRGIPR